MGIFNKLSTAKVFTQSKWFTEGRYLVEIEDVKFVDGHKGQSFVIQAKVLATKNTESEDAPKAGDVCAHVWKVDGEKRDIGLATWMQFLCAILNKSPEEQTDDEWEAISNSITEDNDLKGEIVLLDVFNKPTRAGNPFTYHAWQRMATEADIAEFGMVDA